jgi:hypothetical protein
VPDDVWAALFLFLLTKSRTILHSSGARQVACQSPSVTKYPPPHPSRPKVDTAAGPDVVARKDLLRPELDLILTKLFNLVLMLGTIPTDWKANRTTLPLKEGKDKSKAESYRPITISSSISKSFLGPDIRKSEMSSRLHPGKKTLYLNPGCLITWSRCSPTYPRPLIWFPTIQSALRCRKGLHEPCAAAGRGLT